MTTFINRSYHRLLLEQLIKSNRLAVRGEILDVGSKNRRYDGWFAGTVTAIDRQPNPKFNVQRGDIEQGLDYPADRFDAIVCFEVLEYLDRYEQAIAEMHRLLKPGGVLLLSVPFLGRDHGDRIRFTEAHLKQKLGRFSTAVVERVGNGFTLMFDIRRQKILSIRQACLRYFFSLFLLPIGAALRITKLDRKPDDFYSGLFCRLTK